MELMWMLRIRFHLYWNVRTTILVSLNRDEHPNARGVTAESLA